MRIRIAPDGNVTNSDTGRRLGNVLRSELRTIVDLNDLQMELQFPNTHCNIGGMDPTLGQQASLTSPRNVDGFRPDPDLTSEIVDAIKNDFGSVSIFRISGAAEPFWQNRIFDVLDALKVNKDSNVKVFATTNGTVIDNPVAERWFETVPQSELSFSVDATCPLTYIKLNRIAEYNRVIDNLDNYCRTRNSDHHVAVLRNSINTINIDEIEAMVQMTKDHFFHFVVLTPTKPIQKSMDEVCLNEKNVHRFRDAIEKARTLAEEIGVNVVFSGNWPN